MRILLLTAAFALALACSEIEHRFGVATVIPNEAGIDAGDAGDAESPSLDVIWQDPRPIIDIATDGVSLFWISGESTGSVSSCVAERCAESAFSIAGAEVTPRSLATLAGRIYWIAGGKLRQAAGDGGSVADWSPSGATPPVSELGVSEGLIWVSPIQGAGLRCQVAGTGSCAPISSGNTTRNLMSNGLFVYWSDPPGTVVQRCPLGACSTTANIRTLPTEVTSLAADKDAVYWSARSAGEIRKIDSAGFPDAAAPQPVVSGQNTPDGVQVDGSFVYFLNQNAGELVRVPKQGGSAVVLARGLVLPRAFTIAGTLAFIANTGANNIVRVRLP